MYENERIDPRQISIISQTEPKETDESETPNNTNVLTTRRETVSSDSSTSDEHVYIDVPPASNSSTRVTFLKRIRKVNQQLMCKLILFFFGILIGIILVVCIRVFVSASEEITSGILSSSDWNTTDCYQCNDHKDENTCQICQNISTCTSLLEKSVMCCANLICKNNTMTSSDAISTTTVLTYDEDEDSKGTNFLLMLPEQLSDFETKPTALIPVEQDMRVEVLSFSTNQNSIVIIKNSTPVLNLNAGVISKDGVKNSVVEISFKTKVAVFFFVQNKWHDNSEGYLAIPTQFASNHYLVSSFNVSTFGGFSFVSKSLFTITTVYPDNQITINLKMKHGSILHNNKSYGNNDNIIFTIGKFQTFQLSHTSDLSGTLVSGTKPLFVTSGNICGYVKYRGSCNPLIEMILPVNQWSKKYVVPQVATRPKSTVRIFAIRNTTMKISNGQTNLTKILSQREWYDFIHYNVSYVFADDDVMLMMYPHELSNPRRDSFMMTIHGTDQYITEYMFAVPEGFTSYISLIVPSSSIKGFLLDNRELKTINMDKLYIDLIEMEQDLCTFTVAIASGTQIIKHINNTKFGLWIYGNARFNGYGYPGGIAFKKDNLRP